MKQVKEYFTGCLYIVLFLFVLWGLGWLAIGFVQLFFPG